MGVGVSPSGSMGVLFTVEASASAASKVMAVRKENAGANVFEVEIDATGDGFVGILSDLIKMMVLDYTQMPLHILMEVN